MNLLIDEVYSKQKVEYSAPQGQVLGLATESGNVVSTILTFMVTSLRSKYRDVVALYPVSGLTAEQLNEAFLEVIRRLATLGFKLVK